MFYIFTFSEIKFGLLEKRKKQIGAKTWLHFIFDNLFLIIIAARCIFTLLATPFLGNVIAILFGWGIISLVVSGILCENPPNILTK